MGKIYFDNSSSTRMDERVLAEMEPYLFDSYATPTSDFGYSMGTDAKDILGISRETIAKSINALAEEIIFTSGFTESNNIALKGVLKKLKNKRHIIISTIEDFSILNTAKVLEKEGYEVTRIGVNEQGLLNRDELKKAIRDDTAIVSIQTANQEIGTLQNIKEIAEIVKKKNIPFHTDATHAFMRIPINAKEWNVDLMTIDAYTIHGPRGIGALYIKKGTPIKKIMDGGYQEFDKRAGPENIPSVVGFAKAVKLINKDENRELAKMRDYIIKRITNEIPDTIINGHPTKRIPHNANITFHYVEGESITLHLDMRGIAVSTGSACFSKSLEASHVILGIGGNHERAHGSVRFTFGRFNTKKEIDETILALKEIIEMLRKISPIKKQEA